MVGLGFVNFHFMSLHHPKPPLTYNCLHLHHVRQGGGTLCMPRHASLRQLYSAYKLGCRCQNPLMQKAPPTRKLPSSDTKWMSATQSQNFVTTSPLLTPFFQDLDAFTKVKEEWVNALKIEEEEKAILALGMPPDLLHVPSLKKLLLWYGVPREAWAQDQEFDVVEGNSWK